MRKEYDIKTLKKAEPRYMKRLKKSVTMRVDPQVTTYFKRLATETGIPYQSLIGYVLRDYANHGLRPTASWERLGR